MAAGVGGSTVRALSCWTPVAAVSLGKLCSISRRTQASKVHSIGASAGAAGPVVAWGLWPIADNRPVTRPVMMSPRVAGGLTAAGSAGVTTAAVLAWKRAVERAGVAAAVTVGDALVVGKLAAATSCGRDAADAAGAVVLATLRETFEVVAPLVGEPAAEDPRRGVDTEMFELLLLASGVDFVACADDDAEVCPGLDAVVDRPGAAVVVALLVEVLGPEVAVVDSVLVVSVPVTEVTAPPEACTNPARGSVDDAD
jgi:hypothetical protein